MTMTQELRDRNRKREMEIHEAWYGDGQHSWGWSDKTFENTMSE